MAIHFLYRIQAVRLWLAIALVLVPVMAVLVAQDEPAVSLATVFEADAGQQASLERAGQLLNDNQLDEAVETMRRVMDSDGGRLLALTSAAERAAGFDRWVSVRTACQWRMAAWAATHPAALDAYRQRVQNLAERWYRHGFDNQDAATLKRLTDQLFLSHRGDDALLALGDWALERGDYVAARGAWMQISPTLRSSSTSPRARIPVGAPWWLALSGTFARERESWHGLLTHSQENPAWLAYPDTDLNLADVRARIVLASIQEQSWPRVDVELAWFGFLHPDAKGRLAGIDGLWVELLSELAKRSREPAAPQDVQLVPDARTIWAWPPRVPLSQPRRPVLVEMSAPVVVDDVVLFVAGSRLMALDLHRGTPAFPRDAGSTNEVAGQIVHLSAPSIDAEDEAAVVGRLPGWVTAAGSRVYAVLGGGTFRRGGRTSIETLPAALVGVDLAEEGKTELRVALDGPEWGKDWHWGGRPSADDQSIYVPLVQTDGVRAEVHVAAFELPSGRLRWRQLLAGVDQLARSERLASCLTKDHDRLYCGTNRGAVVCLDAADGRIQWLTRYARVFAADDDGDWTGTRPWSAASNSPLVLSGDQLFAAPADCDRVFSLDANSGQILWSTDGQRGADITELLGVSRGHLIGSGERLYWFDAATGASRGEFPVGPLTNSPGHARPGPHGAGQGLLDGQEVWWPNREQILIFRQQTDRSATGWLPRAVRQIDLRGRGVLGGDLAIVGNVLLVHGSEGLRAIECTASDERPLPLPRPSATLRSSAPKSPLP